MLETHLLTQRRLRRDSNIDQPVSHIWNCKAQLPTELTGSVSADRSTVFVVDDDPRSCETSAQLALSIGMNVELFSSTKEFLSVCDGTQLGCILTESWRSEISAQEILRTLRRVGLRLPVVIYSAQITVRNAAEAMKEGAVDVLEKPCAEHVLIDAIKASVDRCLTWRTEGRHEARILSSVAELTTSERQVLDLIFQGAPNKAVSKRLDISIRTVEDRRSKIMKKLGVTSFARLIQLVQESHWIEGRNSNRMFAVC